MSQPTRSSDGTRMSALPILSNGRLSTFLTDSGTGFVRWQGLAVTRWREDPVADPWGSFLLLRDEENGEVWGATAQPFGVTAARDAIDHDSGSMTFTRQHAALESRLEVAVAPAADIELRRLTVCNHGDCSRRLSLTSYAELVLGPIGDDNAHPAYSKMFVQTEWDEDQRLLLATRRRRSDSQAQVWAAQALQVEGETRCQTTHETDRARFLGRGRTLRNAAAMQPGAALSGSVGCVLDPVFSQRHEFALAPGERIQLLLWTQLADTRDGALALRQQLTNPAAATQLFAAAAHHAEAERQRFAIDHEQLLRFAHWQRALLISDASQRASATQRARGEGGPPTLWGASISGDRPIALLFLRSHDDLALLDTLLLAQRWWRAHQLAMDVVVLDQLSDDTTRSAMNQQVSTQKQQLQADGDAAKAELFCLRTDQIDDSLRDGLLAVARLVLNPVDDEHAAQPPTRNAAATPPIRASSAAAPLQNDDEALEFANGHGGFCEAGRAYRIELDAAHPTPAPWTNVVANPEFGFLATAEGGGYTWSGNSQQNPLTPWPNDPVSDMPHEAIYLRDADSGALWTATALPIRVDGARYTTTHGKGWTRFRNNAHGIELELIQCVPTDDSVKLSRLRLCNHSSQTRRLTITGYVEWALGPNGSTPAPFVVTSHDDATGALFARNRWRADFGERVAFFDLAGAQHSSSGDRANFLGPLGSMIDPAALRVDAALNDHVGAGMDPCGALQTHVELPPNTSLELHFLLGEGSDDAAARALVTKYRDTDFDGVLREVATLWNDLLDTVQVKTPERSMDLLLNDWALYQVTACRLWARTAYYQASGAYGFRDQLQDVMALCVARPDLAREHLLRAAGRQFAEGDVQHWWLPPKGQGIRTKIRDDRVWLAYVAMHYVEVSGDRAVLDEMLPFLTGQAIPDDATDAFFQPGTSEETANVYEHCARAIDSSLTRGAHGLPLIGTGDWNDGMNAVGALGRGESSWLGWFLLDTIEQLAPEAERRGEQKRALGWRDYAAALRVALEEAWDGAWYRRGYYDDGTPLGSAQSTQCRIDTIAQSWSVMAGRDNRAHAAQAMASVDQLLVDHPHQLARLFTPPFDQDGKKDPGYIKGYPPGVRENGGQYTHGATWSVFAWAGLGDGDRAGDQFKLLNPICHGDSAAAIARYKVEPYVVCADVYSVAPHIGRGGWTWYTGSAAWLYRAGLEAVLGFHLHGSELRLEPCIPKAWDGFELIYQHRRKHVSRYEISVENPQHVCSGVTHVQMDGHTHEAGAALVLADDGKTHQVVVTLG
ncbi:glycosyl transferase family 36 [Rhodanobacter sp. AS-Z3]|uniref:GH36-type glycosyl hydrolase domain-containing protein n=1 Tax=Rhodanobacter sp. AS-Z3 TaxID=3031330 RepID=UPI002479CEED|nr:glycosyl transferase family 36 [Rhodanobacter sp. AS-Z3]WEN15600.1 glycosyl transferase family 36 [Rhodanobacter sp. AS-Z3]